MIITFKDERVVNRMVGVLTEEGIERQLQTILP